MCLDYIYIYILYIDIYIYIYIHTHVYIYIYIYVYDYCIHREAPQSRPAEATAAEVLDLGGPRQRRP